MCEKKNQNFQFVKTSGKILLIFSFFCVFSFSSPAFIFSLFKSDKKKHPSLNEKSVIVALGSEPRTLDPRKATDANGMRILNLLFQSLVRIGPHSEIRPSAAHSWSYKDKTYTFLINTNLKFSNGRKINKEDLLFSFNEYRAPNNPFSSSFQIIESVNVEEKPDNFILKIKLKKESAKFLSSDLPVLKILPAEETVSAGLNFQKKIIGTGPFKLTGRNSSQIILSARTDTVPAPKIDKVIFKIIRDDFTRFQKMMNEEIDIAQSEISFQKIHRFLDKKNTFQVFRQPGLSMTYLLINFQDKCLKKKDFRKVVALSINRPKIIHHKLKNFALEAVTILGPNNSFFNKSIKNTPYNLQESQDLFNRIPASCRQKTFSFKTSNARSAINHGKILALQLKRAGLKIHTESFEWGTFYGDLNAGRFQLALLKWVGAMDPDIYRLAFHSKEHPPKGRNRSFYVNKTLDHLLNRGLTEMNSEKRKIIYNQVQKIIQEDLVFIPLWHEKQIAVVRKNIINYHLSDNGGFYYLTQITKNQDEHLESK